MLRGQEQTKYMSSPEVWSDIQSVYDEYLKHHPDDDVARSKYATLCYLGDHYPEADAQFQILGDRLTVWPTPPNLPMEMLKQMREEAAQNPVVSRNEETGRAIGAGRIRTRRSPRSFSTIVRSSTTGYRRANGLRASSSRRDRADRLCPSGKAA